MRELRKRIRLEHQEVTAATPRWTPTQVAELREAYGLDDAGLDPRDLARELTSKPEDHAETELIADVIAGIAELPVTWEQLVENAVAVNKRKKGKDYSTSWHRNTALAIQQITFSPREATPKKIHQWIAASKLDAPTIKNRLSALQGLIERGITSGYQPDLAPNAFKMTDFGISKEREEKNNYYCPTPDDYRKLFKQVLPQLPEKYAVGIELMAWTGCRVSGIPFLETAEEPGWLVVPSVDGTKGGGRVPVPMDLWKRGKGLHVSRKALNGILKEIHPQMCNHSFRSGFKMLLRTAGVPQDVGENLLMHKQQGLEAAFGSRDYPDKAKMKGAQTLWDCLKKIIEG